MPVEEKSLKERLGELSDHATVEAEVFLKIRVKATLSKDGAVVSLDLLKKMAEGSLSGLTREDLEPLNIAELSVERYGFKTTVSGRKFKRAVLKTLAERAEVRPEPGSVTVESLQERASRPFRAHDHPPPPRPGLPGKKRR
jgi:hypothetical protein